MLIRRGPYPVVLGYGMGGREGIQPWPKFLPGRRIEGSRGGQKGKIAKNGAGLDSICSRENDHGGSMTL